MPDFLVRELHDEHRDREWVDAYGFHWAWCEDAWLWYRPGIEGPPGEWVKPSDPEAVNQRRDNYLCNEKPYGPGPFMEAMHHRLLWGNK